MERPHAKVTEAEWSVLQHLWEQGPSMVRQITAVLYPRGGPSEYATVHKLLERLERKGFVRRERRDGVYWFHSSLGRDDLIGQQLEVLVDKTCGGSLKALLTNLIRVKKLKPGELQELVDLVESLDKGRKSRKSRD